MKVYVLAWHKFDDTEIIGVFSSLKAVQTSLTIRYGKPGVWMEWENNDEWYEWYSGSPLSQEQGIYGCYKHELEGMQEVLLHALSG